ncbi:MAG: hypothetical protein NWQ19_00910 [Nonlabens sp.]|nr:hypothetical protein [Nonlabens sp.]
MKNIVFINDDSQRVYASYMKRVSNTVSLLPKHEQTDVLMEINSHIYESLKASEVHAGNELSELLDSIDKLGEPEIVLKPLIAQKKLTQATRTFNPIHVIKALALNITNGISYIIFAVLYLFLIAFVFLILAKLFYPSAVGMHLGSDYFVLGITNGNSGTREILGNAFIPVMLAAAFVLYMFITLFLKFKQSILKKN